MQIVTAPQALPGCCLKCRAGNNRESFVDLEFNFDGYGAVYICNECILEMARVYGMISTEQAVQMAAEVELLRSQLYEAQVTNDGLQKAVDGLTTARRFSNPSTSDRDSSVDKTPERSTGGISSSETRMEEGEGDTPESSDDKRVDVIRPTGDKPEFSFGI